MAQIWTVEDEEAISTLLVDIIESMGHEAVHCYDADELEKRLRHGTPDLMLLDLMLRGQNGFQIFASGRTARRRGTSPLSSCRRAPPRPTRCAGWIWARKTM